MTEQELIKGCLKNDRRSQNELYKRYFPLMSSIARRYSGSAFDAVPAMNGGFLKVLTRLDRYDDRYALATFIRNILINHMIDEFRKHRSSDLSTDMHVPEDDAGYADFNLGEARLEADELLKMLDTLPELSRQVFNLYAIDGYKHHEIATMLGIAPGTSKWHLSEARRKLKAMLASGENEKKRNKIAY